MREAGQGRNPAALSEFECVLFLRTVKNPLKSSFRRVFFGLFLEIGAVKSNHERSGQATITQPITKRIKIRHCQGVGGLKYSLALIVRILFHGHITCSV